MRDDFVVFIITHKRPDNQITYKTLKRGKYTGKIIFVLDDGDDTIDAYCEKYGKENIQVFHKYEDFDIGDNLTDHKGVPVYARNICFKIAREKGYKYFVQLDDDYPKIDYRYVKDGKLKAKPVSDFDKLFEAMRSDFAVFILTHGRADNVATMGALKKGGYTGKWYMIIDDEDETAEQYRKNFGPEHVIMFDKQEAYDRADTMDNFNEHRAIIYARNETFRIAKELGLKYFLMLDDDYKEIDFRYVNGNKLSAKPARQMDRIFEDMLRFLDVSGAATVAFAQGGDFVGGLDGGNFKKGLLRKAMNSLFCRTDRPIDFRGTMNEDVTTYTTLGSRGRLFFTLCNMCVIQIPTQSLDGGMTESYLETGTYVKTFYSVMAMPSCIKVSMMYTKHKRIHHRIDWECCVPKIINEKYRKEVRSCGKYCRGQDVCSC